jgi:hypothetical protein
MTGAQGPDLALYYNKDVIYSSSYATKPTTSATIPDLESTGDWYKIANENTRYYCCRDKSSGSPNDWGDP